MTYLNISVLKLWKSFLSGSVLITSQTNFIVLLLFVFLLHGQYLCDYLHSKQFLLQVYCHENINQSYILKHYIVFACFILQVNSLFLSALIIFVSTFIKMTSYCLNVIFLLNVCAAVVLKSIMPWLLIFCLQKFCYVVFLVYQLFHIYDLFMVLYGLNVFVVISCEFLWSTWFSFSHNIRSLFADLTECPKILKCCKIQGKIINVMKVWVNVFDTFKNFVKWTCLSFHVSNT